MMKNTGLISTTALVFIAVVLMVFFAPGVSFAQSDDIQSQIATLEQEKSDIKKGYNDLNADIGNYNIVEKQLEANMSSNETKRAPLDNKISAINSEKESITRDAATYDAECAGRTFYPDQGEQAAYDRCMSMKNSIEERARSWNVRNEQVQSEIITFNETSAKLVQRVEEQKNALANLNDQEKQLQAREATWDRNCNLLINSTAFKQLMKAEGMSKICREMAEHGDLEGAHDCLQRIWDGKQ